MILSPFSFLVIISNTSHFKKKEGNKKTLIQTISSNLCFLLVGEDFLYPLYINSEKHLNFKVTNMFFFRDIMILVIHKITLASEATLHLQISKSKKKKRTDFFLIILLTPMCLKGSHLILLPYQIIIFFFP